MNKRSIISVFILTLVLFGINQWFDTRNRANIIPKAKTESVITKEESLPPVKAASLSSLPIATLYSDSDAMQSYARAIFFDDTYFIEKDEHDSPEILYVKKGSGMVSIHLLPHDSNHTFSIYVVNPDQEITSTTISPIGSSEVQIVNLSEKQPRVFPARYVVDKIVFSSEQTESGLVLYATNGQFVPVGFYFADKAQYTPFYDISQLSSRMAYKLFDQPVTAPETFYVLENEYIQLVFSNLGGAIAEINLPFSNTTNKVSVVRPIEIDQMIQKNSPFNAYFPARDYWSVKGSAKPAVQKPTLGGYYPLLRRSVKDKDGKVLVRVRPSYYAFALLGEENQEEGAYKMVSFTKDSITFEKQTSQGLVRKKYTLKDQPLSPYSFTVQIQSESPLTSKWLSSGVPEAELISGSFSPSLKYLYHKNGRVFSEDVSTPKSVSYLTSVDANWVSNGNGFFGCIIDADKPSQIDGFKAIKIPGDLVPSRLVILDKNMSNKALNTYPGYQLALPLAEASNYTFNVFSGPYQYNILQTVDEIATSAPQGVDPSYSNATSNNGWFSFISVPFSNFLSVILRFCYSITHSWGLSIILLTIALRIMLYPLNAWSIRSTLKMQELSPKITALQERFKKDPKKLQLEMVKIYKENKVNPFSGCFPIFIQMPFLFGMFDLLKSTFELRGAGFIPGWIDNLTAPDVLFTFGFNIPFLGNQFHLLPIFLGLVMFLQQKVSATKAKTTDLSEQQKQQQMMGNVMTIVFTVIFYNMPSGLNIYFLSSTLLSILQQWWMTKKMQPKKAK